MIKTLSRSLREYKKGSVLTILLSILEAAFEITIPLCMAKVIDEGIDLGNMNAVWKYGIILLVFALFQLITGVLSAHIATRTSVGFWPSCGRICMIMCRPLLFPTLISSRRLPS